VPLPDVPEAAHPAGAFVSLYHRGELRGCIGHIEADTPLARVVAEMAVAAARDDHRFAPVGAEELDELEVQISVLSPCAPARPDDVVPGRHGVLLKHGRRQGLMLPQVAPEYGWSRDTLLAMVCRKAGLPDGAWRDERARLFVFQAQVIPADH
jgi:AmmeMemoRadiSam system protein A